MTIKGPVACSFDFDAESETALRQAHDLALRLGCELIVAHATPDFSAVRPLFPHLRDARGGDTDLRARAVAAVAARVQAVTGRTNDAFRVLVDSGAFPAVVLRFAEEARAGVLVVAPGGHAAQLVRHAHCPKAQELHRCLDSLHASAQVIVAEGSAVQCIAQEATALPAELLVVGTRGRTGLARLALGSVAEALVLSAPCSVRVVRLAAGEAGGGAKRAGCRARSSAVATAGLSHSITAAKPGSPDREADSPRPPREREIHA